MGAQWGVEAIFLCPQASCSRGAARLLPVLFLGPCPVRSTVGEEGSLLVPSLRMQSTMAVELWMRLVDLLTSLWAQGTGAQAGTNGQTETATVGNKGSWACKTLITPSDWMYGFPQTSEKYGRPGAMWSPQCCLLCALGHGLSFVLWNRGLEQLITMVISHKARSH